MQFVLKLRAKAFVGVAAFPLLGSPVFADTVCGSNTIYPRGYGAVTYYMSSFSGIGTKYFASLTQCRAQIDNFCNNWTSSAPQVNCISYDDALRRSRQSAIPSAGSTDLSLEQAAALKTREARARYVCSTPRYAIGPDPGTTWKNGFSSCLNFMLIAGMGKTVREAIAQYMGVGLDPDGNKLGSQATCKIYGRASPNLAASMGCLYLEESFATAHSQWERKTASSNNAVDESTHNSREESLSHPKKKVHNGGSCQPVDERGRSCISLVGNRTEQNGDQINYVLKFENRCNRPAIIEAVATNGQTGSGGVSARSTMELNCTSTNNPPCSGFQSWHVRCD